MTEIDAVVSSAQIKGMGPRIAEARRDAGYTQEELAALIGIGRVALANIERDAHGMRMETLCAICEQCNASADWIIWG